MGEPGTPGRDPLERFAANAVMAIGALIVGLAGLCSGGFVVMSAIAAFTDRNVTNLLSGALVLLLTVAFFGGVPITMGILVFRWGRRLHAPWERVWGNDPARTVAGWVMLAIGVAIVAATVVGAIVALRVPGPISLQGEGFYGVMLFALVGFGLAIVAPVGPGLMIEGYRLARGPKPPPARPPPG